MDNPTVFISYSHDSEAHREQVLSLSERLRRDGIKTRLDQYVNGSPVEGWDRWMLNQLDAANFVLVICTKTYYRRFRGHEQPGIGKGVDWEGALITHEIYKSRSNTLKFVPVFLGEANEDWIPEPLRALSHYALTSEQAYRDLYDFLLGQAGVEPHPLGTLDPKPRRRGTPLNFDAPRPAASAAIDLSRIQKYAPAELIGRTAETRLLDDAWEQAVNGTAQRPHVLAFVALGGEGKTSLVAKWAADLAHREWPGCEAAFAWSFYSQGAKEQTAATADLFLREALIFFGDPETAVSAQHASDKAKRLAQLVGEKRALLILDGVEPLQYPPTSPMPGELKDHGLATLLKSLAARNCGLCVVTTRYALPDLNAYKLATAPQHELKRLSLPAGVELLRKLGVDGAQAEFEKLVEEVQGHALTLNLLGGFLKRAHHGDVRRRDRVEFDKADAKIQGGHAFRAMAAYEAWLLQGGDEGRREVAILRLLGLFDRPADAGCLQALRNTAIPGLTEPLAGLADDDWEYSLTGLETAKLLTTSRDAAGTLTALDAHPLLREYQAQQLRTHHIDAWRAAHRRLFEHLCETVKEGDTPTLEDLQPLYQAVAHGCLAGMQQDALYKVYHARILRRGENYSTNKLGAFGSDLGAVACFFEQPWRRVSPALAEADQAWLLNEAAFRLRGLGRLREALEPMRAGLEMRVKQENWINAARVASNLSELELTLGEVRDAVADAAQSVIHADRSGEAFQRMSKRTTHADALHQAGRRAEAAVLFVEAEKMQAEDQPDYPLLYSVQGFRYCDLLLAAAERAAWRTALRAVVPPGVWQRGLNPAGAAGAEDGAGGEGDACRAVSRRAAQTLQWAEQNNVAILDIALNHLTQSRATLYAAILDATPPAPCHAPMRYAVDGLRRAGTQHIIPLALLTRAWLRSLPATGTAASPPDPAGAQADLDEAWEIAERGPMPLHLADIHLHRARLFNRDNYPWDSPQTDLKAARLLIEKHGWLRRLEELEDAERCLLP